MNKLINEKLEKATFKLSTNFKMSKEHKKMFIDALRSGDYDQTEGAYIEHIQGPNGKPCLCAAGVYLAQLNEIEDLYNAQEEGDLCSIDFGDLHKHQGNEDNDLIGHVIDMNDRLNVSFKGIADWIDKNVEAI